MIKVLRHGNKISVTNPITRVKTDMIDVLFVEEGRTGGDAQMSETSNFLDRLVGGNGTTGLEQLRVHTHPVRAEKIGEFPIGKTFEGHINRSMYSRPAIKQQQGVAARMIDGRPTYFTTYISSQPQEDRDLRMSNEVLLQLDHKAFVNATLGGAVVEVLERVDFNNLVIPREELEPAGNEDLG